MSPAKSKSQKTMACMTLAVKEGKMSASKMTDKSMMSMSMDELKKMCHGEMEK